MGFVSEISFMALNTAALTEEFNGCMQNHTPYMSFCTYMSESNATLCMVSLEEVKLHNRCCASLRMQLTLSSYDTVGETTKHQGFELLSSLASKTLMRTEKYRSTLNISELED